MEIYTEWQHNEVKEDIFVVTLFAISVIVSDILNNVKCPSFLFVQNKE